MKNEIQIRELVDEILSEEGLKNFIKIFEKEHNLFRGSHDKMAVPPAVVENYYTSEYLSGKLWEADGDNLYYDKGWVGVGKKPTVPFDVLGNTNIVGDVGIIGNVDITGILELLVPTKNIYIGKGVVGAGNSIGNFNVYIGYEAGHDNEGAGSNTFLGYFAGRKNKSASDNTLVGYYAGYFISTSPKNTCVGSRAGQTITVGDGFNTCIGYSAGASLMAGYKNVFVGALSGGVMTGYGNTIIGYDAGVNAAASHHRIAIGYNADAKEDNLCAIGGPLSADSVSLAIFCNRDFRFYDDGNNYVGFKAPALGANQIWALPNADGPANEVLGTDNAGNLIWRTHDELAGFEAAEHLSHQFDADYECFIVTE